MPNDRTARSNNRRMLVALTIVTAMSWYGCSAVTNQHEQVALPPPPASVTPAESGFLTDYSALRASEQFASLRFFRDDAARRGFHKLLLRPVDVWRGSDHRLDDIPDEDLQSIADSFSRAVSSALGRDFQMVTQPGPGVLEIHLGLTLVADPASHIDAFSTNEPAADAAPRSGKLADATGRFLRECAFEAEFSEATPVKRPAPETPKVRHEVRMAVFDARRGAETPKGNVQTWEDVDAVFAKWGAFLDERLRALGSGNFEPRLTAGKAAKPAAARHR
ncbi:MAG TPA: DUF3313 domain-containing protein [Candidatus Binatia bacterium]|jgi:hypothetical protein